MPVKERRNSSVITNKGNYSESADSSEIPGKSPCSELELHIIKTGLTAIDSLWRDVSMGSDYISANLFSAVHQELGEIGSELFRRIFLGRSLHDQVKRK